MGFSWATGIVPGTRQEESSSEVYLHNIPKIDFMTYRFLIHVMEFIY